MTELHLLTDGTDHGTTIALAHGAGAPMDSPWMNDFATGLADRGLRVVRFEFPYMHRRRVEGVRSGPNRPPVLLDTWRRVVAELAGAAKLLIGGKSMGGRIASMVADECEVAGLVCLGYPFHPPGAPEKLRTAHLVDLRTPTLILQGTRDPFGVPDEVASYGLADSIQVQWLGDGDHSFKPRVRSGRTLEQNMAEALDATARFASDVAAR